MVWGNRRIRVAGPSYFYGQQCEPIKPPLETVGLRGSTMKIKFVQTFIAPAHGGGEKTVGRRTRIVEMGAMPPRSVTVEFPEGTSVEIPDEVDIRVEATPDGMAYYSWESGVYYGFPYRLQNGETPKDRIALLAEDEPDWDYEVPIAVQVRR